MALEQARSAGKFTPVHDAWWAQARKVHGERDGTRALIEVLLLNRRNSTARRRTPLPSPDGTRGEAQRRHRLQRVLRRLDHDVHRPRLCAAIVDRLTFNGTIIKTGTDSYRLAATRARTEDQAKAS
jgi:hypothetical protein